MGVKKQWFPNSRGNGWVENTANQMKLENDAQATGIGIEM